MESIVGIIVGCAVAAILLFCCVSLTSCCAYRLWSQSKRGKRRVKPADDDLENQNPHGFGSNGEHQPLISVQERGKPSGKRWYLQNTSKKEAVSRLMEDSDRSDGSYVVYDHPDRENSFALLVWWKGHVHKLSINEVRSTDDEGREYVLVEDVNQKKHSTVKALIKYHRGVTGVAIQLEDGTRITLRKSTAAVPLEDKRWYHGNISHDEAESRLRRGCGGKDGTYLVYDSPSSREGSYMYVLLVYYQGEIKRLEIKREKRKTDEGEKFVYVLERSKTTHKDVRSLIKYHRGVTGKPIELSDGKKIVLSEHVFLK